MSLEFLIVGGGAHGCAVAYHLARTGASVRVVEKGKVADGSSGGRGKRGVRGNRRDYRELPLLREAYDLWPDLAEELGAETGYVRTGGVYLIDRETVGTSGGMVAAAAHAQAQSALGVPTELWGQDEVREALPRVAESMRAGLYAPLDGVASQKLTTNAYAVAATRLGAELTEDTAVEQVVADSSGTITEVITSTGESIRATRGVLFANNTGARNLIADGLGIPLPLWNVYPQAVFLRASEDFEIPLLTGHESRPLSVKIIEDDVIMLSGGWRGRLNTDTGLGEIEDHALTGNITELSTVFPHLGDLTVLEASAQRAEAVTPDQIPLIGKLTDNAYLAAGWSAHGWALVPATSKHIARMLLTGRTPDPLNPLSPSRLGI